MSDDDLFAYARHTDPGTSHEAAESLRHEDIAEMEMAVLDGIARREHGATWDELARDLGIRRQSISPRFKPLCRKGLIMSMNHPDGKPIKRPGESNRGQLVWFVTATGAALCLLKRLA